MSAPRPPARAGTSVRAAAWPDSASAPMVTPLQPSVVYTTPDPDALDALYEGGAEGFTYAREGHPNAAALAGALDALEGATGGLLLGSGMAAVTAVLFGLLRSGDHVVAGDQLYGRSLRMLRDDLPRMGISVTHADPTDAAALAAAMRPETRIVLVETMSNPTLRIADLAGARAAADRSGAMLVVDATFTTPRGLRALEHGADIVIHSVTKLLAGHSDVTLGYLAAAEPERMGPIRDIATTFGLTPSPFDCWLAERGLHTFALRHERACATAARLADRLAASDAVARVLYPGRPDHPDHARAMALLGGSGGNMVSFELPGGRAAATAFTRAAAALPFAPTLGDVATTLSHPASSSHRGLTPAARAALGIGEGFFRVSVGIEEPDWLIGTVERALAATL